MLNFITKFSSDATVSIVTSQAALVILTVFGGGMFIAWNKCPNYWFWMQELSLFTQASRSAIMNVMDSIDYTCSSSVSSSSGSNTCISSLGEEYICDVSPLINGVCKVSGRMVLHVTQGTIIKESKWIPFAYLVLIFIILRLAILFLMYYPVERILFHILILFRKKQADVVKKGSSTFIQVDANDTNKDVLTDDVISNSNDSLFIDNGYDNEDNNNGNDINHIITTTGYCLEWKNLSVTLKQKDTVLIDKVSGVALPGHILALMGPSGAGKTTLLNALSNRTPYAELLGEVTFGKRPFTPADLVYVPQFDEFNQDLTIYEQIEFIGNLKCIDVVDMYKRLDKLIPIIGLSNKVHTLCKHLTSGELKRVSVSMGMIANPNVLFLDEPTTGLDSSAAYSIVKFLSNLSKATNVVIIMTIHQPAQPVFDMLQDLYLLEKGRLAYFGPMNTTEKYFLSHHHVCPSGINPADFYLDLVNNEPSTTNNNDHDRDVINVDDGTANNVQDDNNDSRDTWSVLYKKSVFYKNYSMILMKTIENSLLASNPRKPPNSTTRFILLLNFFRKYYSRNIGFYYLRLVFLIIVALFVGTLFLRLKPTTNNISEYAGALFFNIWAILFSAVASTGLLASDRRQAIEQVKNAVITPGVYCLAQFIMSIPFNFILAVIFQSIFHWLVNMNPHGEAFIYAILITMGHLLLMESIMLTVVAVLKNAMLSVTFAMVVMGYLFLFSGFFVRTTDMPVWIGWLSYITPTRVSNDHYYYVTNYSYYCLIIHLTHVFHLLTDSIFIHIFILYLLLIVTSIYLTILLIHYCYRLSFFLLLTFISTLSMVIFGRYLIHRIL